MQATGEFTIRMEPQQDATPAGRFTLDKQFTGGLNAVSKGQMLSAYGSVKGSGGYVALETVTGTLDDRKGSFVLQHSGTMVGGAATLSVTVVPDSGTGELIGLAGSMTIDAAGGRHAYTFDYTLAQ